MENTMKRHWPWAVLSLTCLLLCFFQTAVASPDPVEDIQSLAKLVARYLPIDPLKMPQDYTPEEKEQLQEKETLLKLLDARIDSLSTFSQLYSAMKINELDLTRVKKIEDRLTKKILNILEDTSDVVALQAAVTFLGSTNENASAQLSGPSVSSFGKQFSKQLAQIAMNNNLPESVRIATAKTIGLIRTNPNETIPGLASIIQNGTLNEQRAASRASIDLIENYLLIDKPGAGLNLKDIGGVNMPVNSIGKELVDASKLIIPLALQGMSSDDTIVRRNSTMAMEKVARSFKNAQNADMPKKFSELKVAATGAITSPVFLQRLSDPDTLTRYYSRRALEQFAEFTYHQLPGFQKIAPGAQNGGNLPPVLPNPNAVPNENSELKPVIFWQPANKVENDYSSAIRDAALEVAQRLNDPNLQTRLAGIEFLESAIPAILERGPVNTAGKSAGVRVSEALLPLLKDSSPFVRWASSRTLGEIGHYALQQIADIDEPGNPLPADARTVLAQAVNGLSSLLQDRDLDARISAAKGLNEMASGATSGKQLLQFQNKPTQSSNEAIAIIQNASPHLAQASLRGDREPRVAILIALRIVNGSNNQPKVSAQWAQTIAPLLQHPDRFVRLETARTLGSFAAGSAGVVPALQAALQDENDDVRRAVADAILAIDESR